MMRWSRRGRRLQLSWPDERKQTGPFTLLLSQTRVFTEQLPTDTFVFVTVFGLSEKEQNNNNSEGKPHPTTTTTTLLPNTSTRRWRHMVIRADKRKKVAERSDEPNRDEIEVD